MKNTLICSLTVVGLLFSSVASGFAERVYLRDLPEPIKKAVRGQQRGDDIRKIDKIMHDGRTVYQITIDRKENPVVIVSENGTPITGAAAKAIRTGAKSNLQLVNLPAAVQQTFQREAGTSKISNIDKNTIGGMTVYEIEFSRGGKTEELFVNEDGTMSRDRVARIERNESREVSRRDVAIDRGEAGFDRPLAATRKFDFNNLPDAVKRTAHEQAGVNRIEDTERGTLDGRVIYEIAFKKDGKHNELRVAEDGSIIQRVSGNNIRLPGGLTVDEVPASVRRAIKDQVGTGEVNDIDKKTVKGQTVYEVGFKKKGGGVQHEIQIAEDGTVIGEPAGTHKD